MSAFVMFIISHVTMVALHGFVRNMNHIVMGTDSTNPIGLYLGLAGIGVVVLVNVFAHWMAWRHPRAVQHAAKVIVTPVMGLLLDRAAPQAEFSRDDISPFFWPNGKVPTPGGLKTLAASDFKDYRLKVSGLVENPVELSLVDLQEVARRIKEREKYERRRQNPMFVKLDDEPPPSLDMSDIEAKYGRRSDQRLAGSGEDYYLDPAKKMVMLLAKPAKIASDLAFSLGLAALLLLATYSRGGLLTAGIALILTLIIAGRTQIRNGWRWFTGSSWILRLGIVVIMAGVLAGAGLFLSRKESITRLFNSDAGSIEEFIIANSAGARAAYTFGALGAYEESPWLGVGLGASGFYIYDHLPDWSMTNVPEIARQLSTENRLYPNPKHVCASFGRDRLDRC